ncbi:MAG TPA: ABC transporter permease [Edaphobacter sp.]|nr:ABC transporter permease [Edaphobacter sp.]
MMGKTPLWRRYLRFFGPDAKADVDDELAFHLETKVEELVARGWTPEAAREEARRRFGDVEGVRAACERLQSEREEHRRRRDYGMELRQDVAYGIRQLRRSWVTSLLAVVTLGVGIGAVAAVFSILYAVVLHPLPFAQPDRIVNVWSTRQGRDDVVTPRNFDSWRRETHSFERLAALEHVTFTLAGKSSSSQVSGGAVSQEFFSVFGASPMFGRTFAVEDDLPPRRHLAVLSYRLWRERFGEDRSVLGQQVVLDREAYTVIGVMPRSFDVRPDGEEVWVPLALSGQEMGWGGILNVVGRLRHGVTLRQAQAEMDVEARVLEQRYPEMNHNRAIRVKEFSRDLVGDYRQKLMILLAAVGAVFLIACANVANLLFARGTGRERELAIREALGATRGRIVRQLLTESFVLGLAGAFVGLLLAAVLVRVAKVLGTAVVPRLGEASINLPVLLVLLGLAVGCAVFSGLLPALRAAGSESQNVLAHGGRSVGGLGRDRARNFYIAFEVGLALVLLIAAGLLIRTAVQAQRVDAGFSAENIVTGRTALPSTGYRTAQQIVAAYSRIREDLAAQPGVVSAALTTKVPLSASKLGIVLKTNAVVPALRDESSVEMQYVSPGYFGVMRIPLRSGRDFSDEDRVGSAQVVVVNETMARRLWPGQDAVGKTLRLDGMEVVNPLWQVAGIVADAHDDGLMVSPPAMLYVPFMQVSTNPWRWAESSLYLVARTRTEASASTEVLRKALAGLDPTLPLGDAFTMKERLAKSVAEMRLYTLLLTMLGVCGLVLTAAGIYGVVAYFVNRQRAEIGVRIALGATRANVLRFVVGRGMRPVLAGAAVGVVAAVMASRALSAQLYGVESADAITFAAVTGTLLVVAVFACYIPARQAAGVDPVIVLRGE